MHFQAVRDKGRGGPDLPWEGRGEFSFPGCIFALQIAGGCDRMSLGVHPFSFIGLAARGIVQVFLLAVPLY